MTHKPRGSASYVSLSTEDTQNKDTPAPIGLAVRTLTINQLPLLQLLLVQIYIYEFEEYEEPSCVFLSNVETTASKFKSNFTCLNGF